MIVYCVVIEDFVEVGCDYGLDVKLLKVLDSVFVIGFVIEVVIVN